MSSRPSLRVDWCSHAAAKAACEQWHYSKTIPTSKLNTIGVWESSRFVGTIIFGLGASPSLGKRYGLSTFECCELVRIALGNHTWEVSKMLTISMRLLRSKNPGSRMVISFADTHQNHHGGVYQASGWYYLGVTSPSKKISCGGGRLLDPRRFNGHGFNAPKHLPLGAVIIKTPGKHRYAFALDKSLQPMLESMQQPYPKRVKHPSDAPGHQPGEGGAAPTHALQSSVS